MVELTYKGKWVHSSYKDRVILFAQRTEERLYGNDRGSGPMDLLVHKQDQLTNLENSPRNFLKVFDGMYPSAQSQLLTTEDHDYFILLCRER